MNELILLPCSVRGGAGRGNSSVDGVTRVRRQLAKYIIRKLGAGKMNAFLARVFRSTIWPFSITFAGKFYSFERGRRSDVTGKSFCFCVIIFRVRWRVHTLSWPFYNIVLFSFSFFIFQTFFFSFRWRILLNFFSVSSVSLLRSSCKNFEMDARGIKCVCIFGIVASRYYVDNAILIYGGLISYRMKRRIVDCRGNRRWSPLISLGIALWGSPKLIEALK